MAILRKRNRRGSSMILGLFAIMVLFAFGLSFLSIASSSLVASKRDSMRARALACAEAGVDKATSYIMQNATSSGITDTSFSGSADDPHEVFNVSVTNGNGITADKVIIRSRGTVSEGLASVSRTLEVIVNYRRENVSVWNNVIFGGVGQAGKSINGNVAMRGSIHLLGDGEDYTDLDGDGHWDNAEPYIDSNGNGQYDLGEPFTDVDGDGHRDPREPFSDVNGNGTRDPALTVTDMASEISGNANMGNSYDGMSSTLRSLLPALPQENFGGESVDSLSAKLRVKHGKVNISGSATVGDSDVSGNSVKETLDGTYVSDGFGGNAGVGSVFSDNGYGNGYDLGDGVVKLPVIDSGSYTDGGTTYSNYLSYLQAHATVWSGDLYITKGIAMSITGPNGSISIDSSGNMKISGMVYVTGNISFGPGKSQINYSGNGTLVTPNSSFVHCNLLPKTRFPTTDALGLIAGDRVELATGSGDAQLTMAIAMYAQHKVISVKQSEIAGTIVSSYFEMSNVPRIYQTPDLAKFLPPGLPGADPIWIASVDVESWREVGS